MLVRHLGDTTANGFHWNHALAGLEYFAHSNYTDQGALPPAPSNLLKMDDVPDEFVVHALLYEHGSPVSKHQVIITVQTHMLASGEMLFVFRSWDADINELTKTLISVDMITIDLGVGATGPTGAWMQLSKMIDDLCVDDGFLSGTLKHLDTL